MTVCIVCKTEVETHEHFRTSYGYEFDICSDCMNTIQHQSNRIFAQ